MKFLTGPSAALILLMISSVWGEAVGIRRESVVPGSKQIKKLSPEEMEEANRLARFQAEQAEIEARLAKAKAEKAEAEARAARLRQQSQAAASARQASQAAAARQASQAGAGAAAKKPAADYNPWADGTGGAAAKPSNAATGERGGAPNDALNEAIRSVSQMFEGKRGGAAAPNVESLRKVSEQVMDSLSKGPGKESFQKAMRQASQVVSETLKGADGKDALKEPGAFKDLLRKTTESLQADGTMQKMVESMKGMDLRKLTEGMDFGKLAEGMDMGKMAEAFKNLAPPKGGYQQPKKGSYWDNAGKKRSFSAEDTKASKTGYWDNPYGKKAAPVESGSTTGSSDDMDMSKMFGDFDWDNLFKDL